MTSERINIIDGNEKTAPSTQQAASKWTIEAAKETATRIQPQLAQLPMETIYRLLDRAMDYYMLDRSQYELISTLTGSPIDYVVEGMEYIKNWCRNLQPFYERQTNHNACYIKSTAPVFSVLPSNSDQEVGYVLAQTLLSRNATVVRPSSQGASAYATVEFVKAFNRAVDEEDNPELTFLKGVYSVIHTDTDYLQPMAVDGWNYIFFGGDKTIREVSQKLQEHCVPRNIIAFGTGLSTSVVWEGADLPKSVQDIVQAITINTGNECTSTDIIYAHEAIYDELYQQLQQKAQQIVVGDALQSGNMGCVLEPNREYITKELTEKRGKPLNVVDDRWVAPTIVELHDYETTLEYPGPVASLRKFTSLNHLAHLISRDLRDNDKQKNLVTSVFTQSDETFQSLLPVLKAYMVKHNKPTHDFNINKPHQGVMIVQELVERVWLD